MQTSINYREARSLDRLLYKVYHNSGYDFREYRYGTVMRRLQRRLHATGAKTYRQYMDFLDACPEEYELLNESIIIKVSSFFRNELAFRRVAELVLPEMITDKASHRQRSLRFWSTACNRGEEPHSIAMMLHRLLGNDISDFDIAIYASDISRSSLQEARSGQYSSKDVSILPPAIINGYFVCSGEKYLISDEVKRMVSFRHFNLASNVSPPFADIDCIFCCNVLIYMQRQLQDRVLGMLYNCLNVPGYLVLGESETPTDGLIDKLECLDSKAKIYKKNGRKNHVFEKRDKQYTATR